MAALARLPKMATLIFIKSFRRPEEFRSIQEGITDLHLVYPELFEEIKLFRGNQEHDIDSQDILKSIADREISDLTLMNPEGISEAMNKTVQFIHQRDRNRPLTHGTYFIIVSHSVINSIILQARSLYKKDSRLIIDWNYKSVALLRGDEDDMVLRIFPGAKLI